MSLVVTKRVNEKSKREARNPLPVAGVAEGNRRVLGRESCGNRGSSSGGVGGGHPRL